MPVQVRIPAPLRKLTNDQEIVETTGANIGDVLNALNAAHPGLIERICDEQGNVRRFVNIFVNDEDIRFQDFDEEAFEKELEADVLALSWDDLVDLYDEDEIEYDDSPETEEGEDLEEGITPAGRLKKKFNAMRSKSRRMMARNIAIKRVSSPEKLKSRSIRAARRMVYKRLLRNRDISTVSSSEKTRLEAQIKRMAPMVARLSIRVMPAVRKLEQSRIKNSRTRKKK